MIPRRYGRCQFRMSAGMPAKHQLLSVQTILGHSESVQGGKCGSTRPLRRRPSCVVHDNKDAGVEERACSCMLYVMNDGLNGVINCIRKIRKSVPKNDNSNLLREIFLGKKTKLPALANHVRCFCFGTFFQREAGNGSTHAPCPTRFETTSQDQTYYIGIPTILDH